MKRKIFIATSLILLMVVAAWAAIDQIAGQAVSGLDQIAGQAISGLDQVAGQDLPSGGGSAFTYHDDEYGSKYGTGACLLDDAEGGVNTSTDDLIVAKFGTPTGAPYCTAVSDSVGNSYTVRTAIAADSTVVIAWAISTGSNTSNVVQCSTFASDAADKWKYGSVVTFTPGSGETVSLDQVASGSATYDPSPWETSQVTTSGTDEVCICAFQCDSSSPTLSNFEIPDGTAASTVSGGNNSAWIWYRILTSTMTNGEAIVDSSASNGYVMEMICFKSE